MGIEQHLVRLQQIRPDQKDPAVRQLDMGDLQLGAVAAQHRISSRQSNWNASPGRKDGGTKVPWPVVC